MPHGAFRWPHQRRAYTGKGGSGGPTNTSTSPHPPLTKGFIYLTACRWLRCWTPIFLGRGGNQPLSLSSEYRLALNDIRARRAGERKTWRRSLSEHYEAVGTIVRSLLSAFVPLSQQFYHRQLADESQVPESSDTGGPPHKTATRVGPPIRVSGATNYLWPSPLKQSPRSERRLRESSAVLQSPNGDDGARRCGVGCQCSQCFYYRGWF